jgi:hypothetical protein
MRKETNSFGVVEVAAGFASARTSHMSGSGRSLSTRRCGDHLLLTRLVRLRASAWFNSRGEAPRAIAQMGVHLVFLLHIIIEPDNANNVLALAFGVLIAFLMVAGSLGIVSNLNENMMLRAELIKLHMQH